MEEEIERFSEDPEENLRIENEFLKMKISAQHGGEYGALGGLPPEIENQFLKTVLEFESHAGNEPNLKKIAELLGNPTWQPSNELSDAELPEAIEAVNKLLEKHSFNVGFIADYPNRTIYEFLTNEMMEYETDTSFHMEGMTMNFIYEEFYPNHAHDIEETAKQFIASWLEKDLEGVEKMLPEGIPVDAGLILPKAEVVKKINHLFEAFDSFKDGDYYFLQSSYDFEDEEQQGMAYVEGAIRYTAVLENGEEMLFEGNMKLYFSCQGYGWDLMFFHLPGFNWKQNGQ